MGLNGPLYSFHDKILFPPFGLVLGFLIKFYFVSLCVCGGVVQGQRAEMRGQGDKWDWNA